MTEDASIDGAILKVTPPATGSTPVDVELDYSKFEDLYGTEWASRLKFTQLPECFLTTPDLEECTTAVDVPSLNDPSADTVRATIDPSAGQQSGLSTQSGGGPVVLAASDSAAGSGGSYKATPLSPSGTWSAGGSSGAFSWTYPLSVPAAPAGPSPKIAFTYSSQAVDGKTSVANGQASWVGDGWDYNPGFVERRYRTCSDDRENSPNNAGTSNKKKADLCWASDNLSLSFGGSTTELVRNETGEWLPAEDNGSKIEYKAKDGAAKSAQTSKYDGEYWILTTRDGTRYWFGKNTLTGRSATNSVFTVPVFGNHTGEPCHATAYADSSCEQAWRWNLDYVEDIHGNAMVIDWFQEKNNYAQNGKFKQHVNYVRGGYPTQIVYGLRSSDLSGPPAGKVTFTVAERCIKEGTVACSDDEFNSKNYEDKQPWWDTPSTLHCKNDTTKKCYITAPTFWNRVRLAAVTTYGQRTQGSTALSLVDRWNLHQSFPKQRTDTHPPLWLESITRTGFSTATNGNGDQVSTALPAVSFLPNVVDMPNRVAKGATDQTPGFDRLRVETIRTETGGEIHVDYSDPCPAGSTHPQPQDNKSRCFPVHWSPDPDLEKPPLEWFNKYVVDRVIEKDRVARQPDVVTSYTYGNGGDDAAWAKGTDEFTKATLRTYDQWRGYAEVVVKKGVTANTGGTDATEQSQTRTRYFRGMSADAGRAKIIVKDSTGSEELGEDLRAYQGRVAETITYTKAGGTVATREVHWPTSQVLATRARDGLPALEAVRTATVRTDKIQSVSGNRTRTVRTRTTYDSAYGLPTRSHTLSLTPDGEATWKTGDEACTTTTYVHNTAKHLIGLPQRVRTAVGDCVEAGFATGNQVISDTRISYDALAAFGTEPSKGLPFQVDTVDGDGSSWITSVRTTYDELGRPTKVTDAAGNSSSTSFTPNEGPAFEVTTTNAAGHESRSVLDPARGTVLSSTDPNGRKTTSTYDELGRVKGVWAPSQQGSTSATVEFDYQLAAGKPPAVTTSTLRDNGTYEDSVTIYDGLLRARQTQSEALGGGRVITDNLYNANGTVRQTNNAYLAEDEPKTEIFVPESVTVVPNSTETAYDGLGRPLRTTTMHADVPQHSATAQYEGDWTLTRTGMSADGKTPMPGSRAVKTWTDTLGRTSLVQHYTATDLTLPIDTSYAFDPRGKLATAKDAKGNTWTYTYDARGRLTDSTDPDMGAAHFGFNALDQQIWSQDTQGRKQYTTYDVLGRQTELREDSATGPLVAKWTFDSLPGAKGQPVASTRYYGSAEFTSEITGYDAEYRPTGSKITIPSTPNTTGLAGTYAYTNTYTKTGNLQSVQLPATPGGLAAEKLITRYNGEGSPITTSGLAYYTADTRYSPFGEVLRTASGQAPRRVWTTNEFDENTGRVTASLAHRETANPNLISSLTYGYDTVGNITSITNTESTTAVDRQCFAHDPMGRLTHAWTGTTDCPRASSAQGAGPDLSQVAPGPAGSGYWHSYTFDAIGNRTEMTVHDLTDATLNDVHSYTYGTPISGAQPPILAQPHTLTKVTSTEKTATGSVDSISTYTYDTVGNTTERVIGGDTQALKWDRRNKLTSVDTDNNGTADVTYLYDASGSRLIEDDGTTRTLFLGEAEITVSAAGQAINAQRYYSHPGAPVTVRSTGGKTTGHTLTVLLSDHHNTATTAVELSDGQPVTRRRYDPYGNPRGTQPATWPGRHTFLGTGIDDPKTGLTHIGAREYDSETGRFLSADPILDLTDPLQMNGYTYANGNPIMLSDPTGLRPDGACGGSNSSCNGETETWTQNDDGKWEPDSDPNDTTPTDNDEASANNPINQANDYVTDAALAYLGQKGYKQWRDVFSRNYSQIYRSWQRDESNAKNVYAAALNACFNGAKCPQALKNILYDAYFGTLHDLPMSDGGGGAALAAVAAAGKAKGLTGKTGSGSPCAGRNSFVAGTEVLLADGSSKPIEELEPGDEVMATDPETGKTSSEAVTATIFTRDDKTYVDLTFTTTDGVRTITTTDHHPFWSQSEDAWLDASDLRPGMTVRTETGAEVEVHATRTYSAVQDTYNLTVADLHTYYVIAGDTPILVHNVGNCPTTGLPHGPLGEAATLDRLQKGGYTDITAEVRFINSNGDIFRADFVARDPRGNWVAVESKTGRGATMSDNQAVGYADLGNGAGAVLNTSRVPGLRKGSTVKMKVEVDLWQCGSCTP
ncbi:polymorphic toxin-type HINT domain-containing protein [Streptomyces sp. NPDC002867]